VRRDGVRWFVWLPARAGAKKWVIASCDASFWI